MAYAAYRDHEVRDLARALTRPAARFQVLHVTVSCADAWRVRRAMAGCAGAGVVRCQILLHDGGSSAESAAPRVRLMIRLVQASYLQVLHALLCAVPSGELGSLVSWREHLRRCAVVAEPDRP